MSEFDTSPAKMIVSIPCVDGLVYKVTDATITSVESESVNAIMKEYREKYDVVAVYIKCVAEGTCTLVSSLDISEDTHERIAEFFESLNERDARRINTITDPVFHPDRFIGEGPHRRAYFVMIGYLGYHRVLEKIRAGYYDLSKSCPKRKPEYDFLEKQISQMSGEEYQKVRDYFKNNTEDEQEYLDELRMWETDKEARIAQFWDDIAVDFGVSDHPKRTKLEQFVKSHASSGSWYDLYDLYSQAVRLV